MLNHELLKEITGGPIAPVAFMHYDELGRCVATSPEGGLTVLDQFALGVVGELLGYHQDLCGDVNAESLAHEAYEIAKAMLNRKRKIEAGN